ncbi:hypothetical protein B296_00051503 [Ensete ventricosum]|uniref:Uncharacterized protein n=1 Tax=Ensete ventricosum TaxID=4639 RepID=A0A426YGB6_ENSVE|nr:hypothetical protein B296_00051503 [Ensete ventricosum]
MVEVLYFSQPKSDLKFVILSRAFFYYGPGIGFLSRRAISFIGWAFDNNVNLLLYRRGEVPLSDLTNSLYTSSRHQVTWRSYTLRKLAKSKDKVSSSRWLGVVVRELGAYQSAIDPISLERSSVCGWGSLVPSCYAIEGIFDGATKRLGWAMRDVC